MKFMQDELSKANKGYLDKAVDLAKLSDCNFKHGAMIRKSGRTISVGINYEVNDPKYLEHDTVKLHASVHAEVAAMNACKKVNLTGATLFVARVDKRDNPAMSKPCENCQKMMRARGIKKVYYTIDNSIDL